MSGLLKGLVAGACAMIIAGGGYYFWGEYARAQTTEALSAKVQQRLVEREICSAQVRQFQRTDIRASQRRIHEDAILDCLKSRALEQSDVAGLHLRSL